jgi:4-amino-4-deoxy-L-arabinose transferase-like glycosyltransferase
VHEIAWRPVLTISAALGLVLVAVSGRYGFHRDELYFLAAGAHLDWSYPDQPPLLPLLARAMTALFGDSLIALRVLAALISASGVLIAALTARDLGGGRRAQLLTAGAYAVCPFVVATGHTLSTATVDLLVSSALVWVVVRWVRTRDQRLLLAAGAVAAVALQTKYLVVFLLFGILAGIAISGPREVLRRPMLWAGGAVALLALVPALIWQARHGWPQLEMANRIAGKGDFAGRPGFLPFQLILTGGVLSWLWIYGLVRLLRAEQLRPYRFLAWAYLILNVIFLATGGKPYYLAGLWAGLWAVGAVEVERQGLPRGWTWTISPGIYAVTGVSAVMMALPVYPVTWLARTPQPYINPDAAETVGWPRFAAEVARVYRALPENDRSHTAIVTSNYGEAGALDLYGPALGLPRVYSGHNGYWHFGRPADSVSTTIYIGPSGAEGETYLRRFWTDVRVQGRIDNGVGLRNQEQSRPVWVCRGQRAAWSVLWPDLKHLS